MNPSLPNPSLRAQFHSLPLLEKTAGQISLLRSVVDSASGVLSPSRGAFDGAPPEEFDAESRAAARKTLILAFHQIDNIIDDQLRWGSDLAPLESEAMRLLKAEADKVTADTAIRATLTQPFFLLQARLHRAASGRVMATDSTGAVIGWGDTPKQAIEAFNAAFETSPPEPPAPSVPPPTVKPRRRKKPLADLSP